MLRYRLPPWGIAGRSFDSGVRSWRPSRGVIDQILRDDQHRPKQQRHTAKRLCARLRAEHDFTGGYTIVKASVREQKLGGQEMFVPRASYRATPRPTSAKRLVVIDGVERKAARPGRGSAAPRRRVREGLSGGDDGGVPAMGTTLRSTLRRRAASHRLRQRPRWRWRGCSVTAPDSGRASSASSSRTTCSTIASGGQGQGNDKGKVEGLVGYARRNFFVPVPRFASWDALNLDLANKCRARRGRRLRRHTETIGERFARDRQALFPLPPVPYDACDQRSTRVTSLSLVRYRRNDYSVPTASGHRAVVVKGYVDEVVIVCGSEEIARHRRSYDREVLIFDPRHYLAFLERKTGALDQAAPLVGWALPEEFLRLRRLVEARLGKPGTREYVQVLRLLEDFRLAHVRGAVRDALTLGVIGFDAVKHLTLCRIEHRPPQLDLAQYPHLPAARVATTAAADYLALLGAGTE